MLLISGSAPLVQLQLQYHATAMLQDQKAEQHAAGLVAIV